MGTYLVYLWSSVQFRDRKRKRKTEREKSSWRLISPHIYKANTSSYIIGLDRWLALPNWTFPYEESSVVLSLCLSTSTSTYNSSPQSVRLSTFDFKCFLVQHKISCCCFGHNTYYSHRLSIPYLTSPHLTWPCLALHLITSISRSPGWRPPSLCIFYNITSSITEHRTVHTMDAPRADGYSTAYL